MRLIVDQAIGNIHNDGDIDFDDNDDFSALLSGSLTPSELS